MSDIYTQAMENFEKWYSDFISLFDGKRFYETVRDEIALTGVAKPVTVASIILDSEQAVVRLLDRGALNSIKKFGTTNEEEEQSEDMRAKANARPRGTVNTGGRKDEVTPQAPQSRWDTLTQEQL